MSTTQSTAPESGATYPLTHSLRRVRGAGLAASLGVAIIAGVLAAWLMPRGPITTLDALVWMAGSLLVGLLAGAISGTRWSVAVVAVGFVLSFELVRAGTDGPTVDGLHLGSTYGIIAFVVGRGLSYLLLAVPLLLGGLLGNAAAARAGHRGARPLGIVGWVVVGALGLAIVGLGVTIARPATTAPILAADGAPAPSSITELTSVSLGGHDQALMIRGRDSENPVLLHLAGGPGGTDLGAMRADTSLEDDFVVVTWDQRGTGKSYAALDPAETLTLEQMVADTIELTEYLTERFDEAAIYVHGNSWGSTLAVLAAAGAAGPLPRARRQRPDGQPARDRRDVLGGHRRLGRVGRRRRTGRRPAPERAAAV